MRPAEVAPYYKRFLARDSIMLSALYAIARPSVRPSVCLSVTQVDQSKTVELRVIQHTVATSLYFLWDKFYPEILKGSPERGHRTRVGCRKQAIFVVNAFASWLHKLDLLSQLLQT